jgi:DNA end-binding protein Ku
VAVAPQMRSVWAGAIGFSLINVPVKMYNATQEQTIRFVQLHREDGSRVGNQKVCKLDGQPLTDADIERGYEIERDRYVVVTDEELATAAAESTRLIQIQRFVPREQIDPIYFEQTFYLGPDTGGDRVYGLLTAAMEQAGLAAIATFVRANREHLVCLHTVDGVIRMERMHWPNEVRPQDGVAPDAEASEDELKLALQIVSNMAGSFDPADYRDQYRERLLELITAKASGETIVSEPEAPARPAPKDIVATLMEAVSQTSQEQQATAAKPRAKRSRTAKT